MMRSRGNGLLKKNPFVGVLLVAATVLLLVAFSTSNMRKTLLTTGSTPQEQGNSPLQRHAEPEQTIQDASPVVVRGDDRENKQNTRASGLAMEKERRSVSDEEHPSWLWNPNHFETTSFTSASTSSSKTSSTNRLDAVTKELQAAPQCKVLGTTFIKYVAEYLVNVHEAMERQQRNADGDDDKTKFWGYQRRLIYSCESDKKGRFCGGMGDRFRGMISTFFLALLTKRKFELYHPTPTPIQEFLHPNLLNWIPSIPHVHRQNKGKQEDDLPPPSTLEVEDEMARYNPDMSLMRLKGHKTFLPALAKQESTSTAKWKAGEDLTKRVQCNSYGVDGFLGKAELLQRRKEQEMGLHAHCNISCYFGCLNHILFRRSKVLGDAMREVLSKVRAEDGGSATPLAHPNSPILTADENEEHQQVLEGEMTADVKAKKQKEHPLRPLITVQIRMGGDWAAKTLRIPEPFRTHPSAVKHFFSMIAELRSGTVPGHEYLKDALIFVSSDAERLINETAEYFGASNVLKGKSFSHTDTMDAGKINPKKFSVISTSSKKLNYLGTLLNHQLIGEGDHVVMAQSGFGDTAFWRSRVNGASCIFVDMNNNRYAWQHHLSYSPHLKHPLGDGSLAQKLKNDKLDRVVSSPVGGLPAYAVRNRIVDIKTEPKPFY